jgi:PAS domain S-box-containing protein
VAAAMRAGAHGFLRKDKLSGLGVVVDRELAEQNARQARRRVERELRSSETRYRALFNSCPLPMWAYDAGTLAVVAVNDAAVTQYGHSREDLTAMTMADLMSVEAPSPSRGGSTDPSRVEWAPRQVRRKDGTVAVVTVGTRLVDGDGGMTAVAVCLDTRDPAAHEAWQPQDALDLALQAGPPSLSPSSGLAERAVQLDTLAKPRGSPR